MARRSRRGVLHMGGPILMILPPRPFGLGVQRLAEMFEARQTGGAWCGSPPPCAWPPERVVGRWDMLNVMFDGRRFSAHLPARHFNGPVRDHLIDIHVGLCVPEPVIHPGAEMIVERSGAHLSAAATIRSQMSTQMLPDPVHSAAARLRIPRHARFHRHQIRAD
jgi:hypothetical protein